MSTVLDLHTPVDAALDAHLERDGTRLARRERRSELVLAVLYLGVAAGLLVLGGGRGGDGIAAGLASMVVVALAMNVRFDVPGGFTVPIQLGFVPLLFAVPPSLVPAAVLLAVVAGRLPAVVAGTLQPGRLLLSIPNCMFALGPAVILTLVGRSPLVAVLAASLVAQLLGDFLTFAWRDRYENGTPVREQLRDSLAVYVVDVALTPVGVVAVLATDVEPLAPLALLPLLAILGVFSRERRARMESLHELNSAYRGTALVLGDVIEADDDYTGEHSKDVVELAMAAGAALGLPADRQRDLEFGALLHDVGKVAIPKSIINKPGALDEEEWAIMRTHAAEGQRMLDRVGGFMVEVGKVVRSHHERWDGGGYPDGLAGEQIPIESRIIAACDTYNAMTTDRPYRRALPAEAACAELRACAGSQFDPAVVEAVLTAAAATAPGRAPAPVVPVAQPA